MKNTFFDEFNLLLHSWVNIFVKIFQKHNVFPFEKKIKAV